jgi:serine/threonine protein kinase
MQNQPIALQGYTLLDTVHRGGDTLVWRGRRDADGAKVAVKTSPAERTSARQRARLRHEYSLLGTIGVPGVVRALDLVTHGERTALVLEWVEGRSLRQWMDEGRLETKVALEIAASLCDTLSGLHRKGIVHKDLSPANVIYDAHCIGVHLIDFDLASVLAQEPQAAAPLARLEGTLAYLSPEQTGRTNRPVDQRSDLYSLGAVLYEMLAGEPPFPARDPLAVVYAHIARQPIPLHERAPGMLRAP